MAKIFRGRVTFKSLAFLKPYSHTGERLVRELPTTSSLFVRGMEMGGPIETKQKADLRDYLAAERTFLAWIRTGLALMGFGFVVARFGLFLGQLEMMQRAPGAQSYGLSLWFGTGLIAAGVAVNLSSVWHHVRLVRELDRGEPARGSPLAKNVTIALFLALVGLAMAIYLIFVRGSATPHL